MKDLMFSISKNPQASMAEVLAKTEKYINVEESLLSKQRSSSSKKERSRGDKKRERSPKRQADRDRSPRRSRENKERSPTRRGNVKDRRGPPQPELQQRYSPQQYTPLTASAPRSPVAQFAELNNSGKPQRLGTQQLSSNRPCRACSHGVSLAQAQ